VTSHNVMLDDFAKQAPIADSGATVASIHGVSASTMNSEERRDRAGDRRHVSRNGRRSDDPKAASKWRRLGWLFAAYVAYTTVRSLPQTVKRIFARKPAARA